VREGETVLKVKEARGKERNENEERGERKRESKENEEGGQTRHTRGEVVLQRVQRKAMLLSHVNEGHLSLSQLTQQK